MSIQAVLLPVFVQVGLTFFLLFWTASVRTGAITRGEVKMGDIALGQPAWSERCTKVGNAFRNQFELPVLFYVLVVLALPTHKADLLFVVMSWIFVITRILHAFIHTGINDVRQRFYAFATGAIFGSPLFGQIRERDPAAAEGIRDQVEARLRREYGSSSPVLELQAIVFEAVRGP